VGLGFVQLNGSLFTLPVSLVASAVQMRGDQKGISVDDGVSPLADGVLPKILSVSTQMQPFFRCVQ
jgi:hypothetical protein